jgi:hypothetical protein
MTVTPRLGGTPGQRPDRAGAPGVPATEVARRAGHSVVVLLKMYAHRIDGQATPPISAWPTPSAAVKTGPDEQR